MNFILDTDKWICGKPNHPFAKKANSLGEGRTLLLNKKGYQCCLGQFSCQLGVEEKDLIDKGAPFEVFDSYSKLLLFTKVKGNYHFNNSSLAQKAMAINDDVDTRIKTKIKRLQKLFESHEHTIEIVGTAHLNKV